MRAENIETSVLAPLGGEGWERQTGRSESRLVNRTATPEPDFGRKKSGRTTALAHCANANVDKARENAALPIQTEARPPTRRSGAGRV